MSPTDFDPSYLKVGLNSTVKALKKGIAVYVFMAYDADDFVKNKISENIGESSVQLCLDYSTVQLGMFCNIEVPCAVCCAVKTQ